MKNPNGYGSVWKLKGRLRKPWYVQKTIGYDENGKQIRKGLGSYRTREEAMRALANYNGNPYDIDKSKFTFKQFYNAIPKNRLKEDKAKKYQTMFNALQEFHNRRFMDITQSEWERAVNDLPHTVQNKRACRSLLSWMYDEAISNGICSHKYSNFTIIGNNEKKTNERKPFTSDEIIELWEHAETRECAMILILIYSGVRISELLKLNAENVCLEQRYFDVIDAKTPSGVRRVPIAEVVVPLWERYLQKDDAAFRNARGWRWSYDNFLVGIWRPAMETLGMKHTVHETRHTCITFLKVAQINDVTVKQIVGHKSSKDITDGVYTHIPFPVKLDAINKLDENIRFYAGRAI